LLMAAVSSHLGDGSFTASPVYGMREVKAGLGHVRWSTSPNAGAACPLISDRPATLAVEANR
jgi:hypothetical protein